MFLMIFHLKLETEEAVNKKIRRKTKAAEIGLKGSNFRDANTDRGV